MIDCICNAVTTVTLHLPTVLKITERKIITLYVLTCGRQCVASFPILFWLPSRFTVAQYFMQRVNLARHLHLLVVAMLLPFFYCLLTIYMLKSTAQTLVLLVPARSAPGIRVKNEKKKKPKYISQANNPNKKRKLNVIDFDPRSLDCRTVS